MPAQATKSFARSNGHVRPLQLLNNIQAAQEQLFQENLHLKTKLHTTQPVSELVCPRCDINQQKARELLTTVSSLRALHASELEKSETARRCASLSSELKSAESSLVNARAARDLLRERVHELECELSSKKHELENTRHKSMIQLEDLGRSFKKAMRDRKSHLELLDSENRRLQLRALTPGVTKGAARSPQFDATPKAWGDKKSRLELEVQRMKALVRRERLVADRLKRELERHRGEHILERKASDEQLRAATNEIQHLKSELASRTVLDNRRCSSQPTRTLRNSRERGQEKAIRRQHVGRQSFEGFVAATREHRELHGRNAQFQRKLSLQSLGSSSH